MVKYVKGDLLKSNCDYICHQVNCQGVMGSGIARQIRERWPEVYEDYRDYCDCFEDSEDMLGGICVSPMGLSERKVINIFSQHKYGYDGHRYTSYDAFAECLHKICGFVSTDKTIGFPKNIGCGLGGGNWKVISALIEEILGEDFDVYIYEFEV